MKSHENFNNTNFTHRFYIKSIYFFGKRSELGFPLSPKRHPIAFYSARVDFPLIADHTTTSMTCERLNSKPTVSSSKHSRTSSDLREHINVSFLQCVGSIRVIFRRRQSVTRLGRTPKIILPTIKLRSAYTMITLAQDTFTVVVGTRKLFCVVFRTYFSSFCH